MNITSTDHEISPLLRASTTTDDKEGNAYQRHSSTDRQGRVVPFHEQSHGHGE